MICNHDQLKSFAYDDKHNIHSLITMKRECLLFITTARVLKSIETCISVLLNKVAHNYMDNVC